MTTIEARMISKGNLRRNSLLACITVAFFVGIYLGSRIVSPGKTAKLSPFDQSHCASCTTQDAHDASRVVSPFRRPYLLEGTNDRKDLFSSYSEEPGELKNPKYASLGFTRLTYGDLLAVITFLQQPRRIVEFGVLYGFALDIWVKRSHENCTVEGYDLFEDNDDGHMISRQNEVEERFKGYSNLDVKHADFYADAERILSEGEDVDILHIDVNNSGDTVSFALNKLWKKVRVGGVIIFEGGSKPRDSLAPEKTAMHDVLSEFATRLDIEVMIVDAFPSISILRKLQ
jgi:hypothetical protein